jgi:hypothetical protein
MKAKEIYTEIDIDASAEKVWDVLADFKEYPKWNPFIINVSGKFEKGAILSMTLKIPHHKEIEFQPQITKVDNKSEFRMVGKKSLGGMGLIEGEHVFRLKKSGNSKTSFYQIEFFKGFFLAMIWGKISYDTQVAFERMNEALKKRCEH